LGSENVFVRREVRELVEEYIDIWSLQHALSLMGWDIETYMPEDGVYERSIAMSRINLMIQRMITRREFIEKLERAEKAEDLNDYERGVVRVLRRLVDYYTKIPPRIVEELSRITSEASVVWRNAKAKDDYDLFKPYLARIFGLEREIANHLGYREHPYDALLDLYEEGLTTREFKSIIDRLVPGLKSILDRIISEGYFPQYHRLEEEPYDVNIMRSVNKKILEILGHNPKRLRLDESAHPFTSSMGIWDVRITTRYEGKDFRRTILSVIHEYGHALYELQIDESLRASPLATGASLGIHESQSRFWELMIGKSRPFIENLYRNVLNGYLWSQDPEDLYRYFNIVRPSLIRVDADEVTYNLHIAVRFEIERLAISGEINVNDMPEMWNDLMDRYLGIKPKKHSEGVLQDIHWSQGSVGYFPTYTLGTIIAAQLRDAMEKDLGSLYNYISTPNLAPIREWLRIKIHRWGSTYAPKELLKRSLGIDIDPTSYLSYLEKKYITKTL
jgi:carboxypeptidase Taq